VLDSCTVHDQRLTAACLISASSTLGQDIYFLSGNAAVKTEKQTIMENICRASPNS
jgi:hypothetical protein